MRAVVLFLLLAGAGLTILAYAAGGLLGVGRSSAKPEVPVVAPPAQTDDASMRLSEFPIGQGLNAPDFVVQPIQSLDVPFEPERAWIDPVSKERIVFPFYREMTLHVEELEAFRDAATGAPGERWRRVHVTLYRDVGSLTREEAERLAADPREWRNNVLCEIRAAEGHANFPMAPLADGRGTPQVRMLLHLARDVEIHVVREDIRIRTSDVTIDREAGTAEGTADILAESPSFRARGRGFRLDRTAQRLEIVASPQFDILALEAGATAPAMPFDLGSGSFQPRIVRARGPAVLVQRDADDGQPLYELSMRNDVHAEADDGSRMDADSVELRVVRDARRKGSDGGVLARARGGYRLVRIVAEGAVSAESGQRTVVEGKQVPTFVVEADRMSSGSEGARLDRVLLEGRTTVRWVGELSMPGGRREVGTLFATCRDRLSYGPLGAAAELAPGADAVVDLVGSARVESNTAAPGEDAESVAADRLQVFLRRRPKAVATAPAAPSIQGLDTAGMQVLAFAATGGDVRLSGPRISGWAREMKGFGLDTDTWRIVASGPDTRLEVTDAVAQARGGREATKSERAPGEPPPARTTWTLDRLEATEQVRGTIAPQPGSPAITFSGASLGFTETTGGELRGEEGRPAVLVHPGPEGRDDTVEAAVIGFQLTEAQRRLWTRGGTRAVMFSGARALRRGTNVAGGRRFALRSGSRIEFEGGKAADGASSITIRSFDGAAFETRVGTVEADRIAARTIVATLAERASGGLADLLRGSRGGDAAPKAPGGVPASPVATSRWVLDCREVDVVLGAAPASSGELAGLQSFEARGAVDARSDAGFDGASEPQRFEGERLVFAGTTGLGRLEAAPGLRARLTMGAGELAQRIAAPAVDFALVGGRMGRASLQAPVTGLFHVVTKGKPSVERYVVKSDHGPLEVEGDLIVLRGTTEGPVVVERSVRGAPEAPFVRSLTLASPKVTLAMGGPAASSAPAMPGPSGLKSFSAEGPQTRVEVLDGSGGGTLRVMGDRIAYDPATQNLRLEGAGGVKVLQVDADGRASEGWLRWFAVNTTTGALDGEGGDILLRVRRR